LVLGMNQLLLSLPGLGQPLLIHLAHIKRGAGAQGR
jgi:hypothetical protein